MFVFDQVAVRTTDMHRSLDICAGQGHRSWVRDTVTAQHLFARPDLNLGETFRVELAFNYEFLPGIEFELIRLVDGQTCQLPPTVFSLSHFGYHIADQINEPYEIEQDSLLVELRRQRAFGLEILQVSQTVAHENTQRRYRYAFVQLDPLMAPVKIIQRIVSPRWTQGTVEAGKELYTWLS